MVLGLIWMMRCQFPLVLLMEREVTIGGVEVMLTVSQQSALRVSMMLVNPVRLQDQQDLRL